MLLIAAVQPVRHGDRLGRIVRHVRVEQVQRNASDVDAPDAHLDVDTGEIDAHLDPGRLHPERRRIDAQVDLLLPAVGVQLLVEVALGVEQADADERDAEVGRRLEVVAGQHAEPARVLGERFGDAELRREVGDEFERGVAACLSFLEPRAVARLDRVEAAAGGGDRVDELGVCGERFPARRRGSANEIDRVLFGLPPRTADGAVEAVEQGDQRSIPRPVQVRGKTDQRFQRRGQTADDGELMQGAHGPRGYPVSARRAREQALVDRGRRRRDRIPGVRLLDERASV